MTAPDSVEALALALGVPSVHRLAAELDQLLGLRLAPESGQLLVHRLAAEWERQSAVGLVPV